MRNIDGNVEQTLITDNQYVPFDWQSGALAEGLHCYRSGEFFLAHEHWESVWTGLEGQERKFLQALIQVTVALHHWQAGNLRGCRSLLQRALRRLELCPANFGGIAVAPLRSQLSAWLGALEHRAEPSPLGIPEISPMG